MKRKKEKRNGRARERANDEDAATAADNKILVFFPCRSDVSIMYYIYSCMQWLGFGVATIES